MEATQRYGNLVFSNSLFIVGRRPRRKAKAPNYLTFDFSATSSFADFAHPLNKKLSERECFPMTVFTEESAASAIANIESFPSSSSRDMLRPMIEESIRVKQCDGNLGWITKMCIYGPVCTNHYPYLNRSIDYYYVIPSSYRHRNEVDLPLLYDAHLLGDENVIDDYKSAHSTSVNGSSSSSHVASNRASMNGIPSHASESLPPIPSDESAAMDESRHALDDLEFNENNNASESDAELEMNNDIPMEADVDINDSSSSDSEDEVGDDESSDSESEDGNDNDRSFHASDGDGNTSIEEISNDTAGFVDSPVKRANASSNVTSEIPSISSELVVPDEFFLYVRPSSPVAPGLVYLDVSRAGRGGEGGGGSSALPPSASRNSPKGRRKKSSASFTPLVDLNYTATGTVITTAPLNPALRVVKVFVTQHRMHPVKNTSVQSLSGRVEPRIGFMMGKLRRSADGFTVYFIENKGRKVYRERIQPHNFEILTRKAEDQGDIEHIRKKINLSYDK